jgi:hypothetical protein
MSDNNTTPQQNDDIDTITIDDLSLDTHNGYKPQRRIDLDAYKEKRAYKTTNCTYCAKKDICGNGIFSKVAKNRPADYTEPPVWFCCECCSSMYKHETGIIQMPEEQFKEIFQRCYPAMFKKRYSV